MFESTTLTSLFQSIEDILDTQSSPGTGWRHLWRSYFRSPLIRDHWLQKRPYFNIETQFFIRDHIWPRSPSSFIDPWENRCCYFCDLNTLQNPITLIMLLFTLFLILGSWTYWYYAPLFFPSSKDRIAVYLYSIAFLGFIATVLLLVYSYVVIRTQTMVTNFVAFSNIHTALYRAYPWSIPLYREMYACDSFVQQIEAIPTCESESESESESQRRQMIESTLVTTIFQSINNVLLSSIPDDGDVNAWSSFFLSKRINHYWTKKRCFFDIQTQDYVNRRLFRPDPLERLETLETLKTLKTPSALAPRSCS